MENKDITSTIDQDILHRYIQGLATNEEIRMVEQAMGDDMFLQDALEGLKEVKDKSIISQHLADISNEIGQKSSYYPSKAGKTIQLPQMSFKAIISVAASIVIISGTYLIAHNIIKSNKQIAQNTSKKEAQAQNKEIVLDEKTIIFNPAEKENAKLNTTTQEDIITKSTEERISDESIVEDNSPTSVVSNEKGIATYSWTLPSTATVNKIDNTSKNIVKGQILDSKTKNPIAGVNIISGKTSTLSSQNGYYEIALEEGVNNIEYSQAGYQDQAKKLTTSGTKTVNVELNKSFDSDIALNAAKDKESITEEKTATETTTTVDDFKKGLDDYSNQEYEKAITSFNKVLQKNPNSPEANYYNGLANYNTNKNTKALGYFNKVIKANNKYVLDAKWQKAQILLQQNNYTEAKPILEELKNTTKYKSQAESILNTKK